jgi:hypothetical protein
VIGLSHVWRAHMVYVHWVQHPVNQHQIAYRDLAPNCLQGFSTKLLTGIYRDDDLVATIEDALRVNLQHKTL